jgi:ABC-2 type transport system permease protein
LNNRFVIQQHPFPKTLSFGFMWIICKKEWQQFFNNLTGYIAIAIFLLLNGLFLFVFPETSLLDFGYASLSGFFNLCPWILLFLVPTITMRSLSDEYKGGTFELLKTWPLSPAQIVWGKFFGALIIVAVALLPTVVYAVSMQQLSAIGGIDAGSTAGSYIGLLLLGAVFTAVGICTSSFTNNTVVAFITGAFLCFLLYTGFEAISKLPVFHAGADYYIEMMGIHFHYNSISRGVIDTRDLVYFASVIVLFLLITQRNIIKR